MIIELGVGEIIYIVLRDERGRILDNKNIRSDREGKLKLWEV